MRLNTCLLAVALGACALPGFAAPVSGTVDGTWVNPNPTGGTVVVSGVNTSTFTWGTPAGTAANSVNFNNGGGNFTSSTETAFKVGTITYFNGTTEGGSSPDSVQLALTLDFADPALGPVTSDYTFNIVSTTNTDDPDASADYLYLPTTFSTTQFLIGGTTYDVKLTGFENIVGDGFLDSSATALHVREGGTASADLFADVTTQTAAVPEPQNMALMFAGLGMVGLIARRRRG